MIVDTELSKQYYQSDIKEHAKKKSMWGGSFEPSDHEEYILVDGCFKSQVIRYADSLNKNFDEVLVNVVDIYIKSRELPAAHRVSVCTIDFTRDGYISIYNNGQGIPTGIVKNLEGNPIYTPQLLATVFLAGSNNDNDDKRITGGVNGVGLSMVNANSTHFILETADLTRKQHYKQECFNRLDEIGEPVITPVGKRKGTTIKFLPAYSIYACDIKDDKEYNTLNNLFKSRAYQIAAHTRLKLTYNGEALLDVKDRISEYAKMFIADNKYITTRLDHSLYPWDVVIGLSSGSFESLSIINGVCVKTGNHINYIRDLIINGLKPKVVKLLKNFREYKKTMVQSNLFIMISGNIPNPAFDSQTKNNISGDTSKYLEYTISNSILLKIWKILEPRLSEQYLATRPVKATKVSTIGIKKYKKAKFAGTAKSSQCSLLICEGDSAESMTRTALTSVDVPMNYEFYGTFNIGGVPMNSRTKTEVKDGKIRRHKQLVDNERLSSLSKVLNLNLSFVYETAEERNTLSYGCIVVTVDQDLDGIGQIFGLLLSHVERFWPALIRHGFVKHLATPIIRAFPKRGKQNVISFYTDSEYREWAEKKFGSISAVDNSWEIKYYKGLATHNDTEAIHMFQHYNNSLYTMLLDDNAARMFEIYYGDDPKLRRTELITTKNEFKLNGNLIDCTTHLQTHTKDFQLDNILRKLPHLVDGLVPARRKILCGSRKRFKQANTEVKVGQLAGYVAEHMNYHHGSASLEKTIINMAQDYVGANNLPLLLPLSQFGSRFMGGKDCGASRYIKTKLNKELVNTLFREEDDYVIDYTYDEGETNEPVFYVPIAPYVLLESLEIPATGWKYSGFARRWDQLYINILSLIDGKEIKQMDFWCNKWNGTVIKVEDNDWFVGRYRFNRASNTVTVAELPFQVWNESYIEKIQEKPIVVSVDDMSSKLNINLTIKLKPKGIDSIYAECENKGHDEFDVIEEYFSLKKRMNMHLNVIENGCVRECTSYNEILIAWFAVRRETYVKRFARLRVLTAIKIDCLRNVIRFVSNYESFRFNRMDENDSDRCLLDEKYTRFNKTLLDNPGFIPTAELKDRILDEGASFDYLYNINARQCMEAARTVRASKLKKLQDYYTEIMAADIVNTTWKKELLELNDIIIKGTTHERGWLYNESKARF